MRQEEEAAEKNTCEKWEIGFLSWISALETGREPTWMSKASYLRRTPSGSWTPGAPLRSAITPGGETEASWEEKQKETEGNRELFHQPVIFFQEFLTAGAISSAETAALGILFGFNQPWI